MDAAVSTGDRDALSNYLHFQDLLTLTALKYLYIYYGD